MQIARGRIWAVPEIVVSCASVCGDQSEEVGKRVERVSVCVAKYRVGKKEGRGGDYGCSMKGWVPNAFNLREQHV